MQLFIEPIDVWLFRDGRPFDALSDHRAESLFPPFPTVVQGAIRSHQLILQNVDLSDRQAVAAAVGTGTDYGTLRLRGPIVARLADDGTLTRYFPRPADAALDGEYATPLQPKSPPSSATSSVPTPQWLLPDGEPQKPTAGDWLTEQHLLDYLEGKRVPTDHSSTLFRKEARPGIARTADTHTVREGALFEVEFVRPALGVGLWVEVEGYAGWPDAGAMRIGGEGRGAMFRQLRGGHAWPSSPNPLPKQFKIYFATPTYFDGGWQPVGGVWGRFFDGKVDLVAAAVNRYESVGGFDWAKSPNDAAAHRPARRYVPAGSVYFFTSEGAASLTPALIQNAVSDFALQPNRGAEIGFGQVLIKEW